MLLQADFWKELDSLEPSLLRLDSLGWDYDESSRTAEEAYKQMLQLNPQGISVMRQYAQFLVEVTHNLCRRVRVPAGTLVLDPLKK